MGRHILGNKPITIEDNVVFLLSCFLYKIYDNWHFCYRWLFAIIILMITDDRPIFLNWIPHNAIFSRQQQQHLIFSNVTHVHWCDCRVCSWLALIPCIAILGLYNNKIFICNFVSIIEFYLQKIAITCVLEVR